MSPARLRAVIFIVSMVLISHELILMRILALRFWSHFASMVISVALLGMGASGTALTVFRPVIIRHRALLLLLSVALFGISLPLTVVLSQRIDLDVHYLAWNITGQWCGILALEILMFIPFFLSGAFIGMSLLDEERHIPGHYAANLAGSGLGAVAAIGWMHVFDAAGILKLNVILAAAAVTVLVPWRERRWVAGGCAVTAILVLGSALYPVQVSVSPYKKLSLELSKPDARLMASAHSPLGRLDVVEGPAIHDAPPGMSLNNPYDIPPRRLILVDAEETLLLFDTEKREDWAFLDYNSEALAYHAADPETVLILGSGGGSAVGLAGFHHARAVTVLESNPWTLGLMTGPLARYGGDVFSASSVIVLGREPRGFLSQTEEKYDLILLPLMGGAGSGGASLLSARESSLMTVEGFRAMINCLSDGGLLCVTQYSRNPPRETLRLFDLGVQSLKAMGVDPARRLAMIRSWETGTLLVSRGEWPASQVDQIRSFCRERGFDLSYLPGLRSAEANYYHVMGEAYDYEGAMALAGTDRERFLSEYLFDVRAPVDDKPYFHNFLKWRRLPELYNQLRGRMPAFVELGTLLLVAALAQAVLLAPILLLVPLAPGIGALRGVRGRAVSLGYFLLLGAGFMLLEMGFLQRLVLVLAHPIYSVAVAMGAFLVFGGLGSFLCSRWQSDAAAVRVVVAAIVVLSVFHAFFTGHFEFIMSLDSMAARCLASALLMAPLAIAMGHLFPLGLKRLTGGAPSLVPWAWALNGFASVIATVAAPLVAMTFGFRALILSAAVCYVLAAVLFVGLPKHR